MRKDVRGAGVVTGWGGGAARGFMPSWALAPPPSLCLGPSHGLDSTRILPQLIPGLSQLSANRQPHKKSSQMFFKKKKNRTFAFAHIEIILGSFFFNRDFWGNQGGEHTHLITRTAPYFLCLLIVGGFVLIMSRGIPPLRQPPARLNMFNRGSCTYDGT